MKRQIDMTTGSPAKQIIAFTLPIFLGNLFQQIYSISDTFVVGRYLGKEALAAVGACSAIVIFITSVLIGLCMGSGVFFSDLYGAKKHEELSLSISTSAIFIFFVTVAIMLASLLCIEPFMRLFQIPEQVMGLAKEYLTIILWGLPFLFLYNMAVSRLLAVNALIDSPPR